MQALRNLCVGTKELKVDVVDFLIQMAPVVGAGYMMDQSLLAKWAADKIGASELMSVTRVQSWADVALGKLSVLGIFQRKTLMHGEHEHNSFVFTPFGSRFYQMLLREFGDPGEGVRLSVLGPREVAHGSA